MLRSMGSQRVGHDWATKQQQVCVCVCVCVSSVYLTNLYLPDCPFFSIMNTYLVSSESDAGI